MNPLPFISHRLFARAVRNSDRRTGLRNVTEPDPQSSQARVIALEPMSCEQPMPDATPVSVIAPGGGG